ncbi:hypothetical protein [Pseudoclavibacter sp. VKM Ac-2867]|uniref:hypothetical protein n=1 Tax=Pseudoclavibacter sp. VKM Ac-2867 TaxID=2783829 RepID=UPI00188D33A0|nr:hypothetical protein [Pseudoclavibacter sp. VKM Ac-2867]MBF4458883.1 hypothetical protein [Pseudoclavibacter sp. VKM Ac-2867]
MEDNRHSDARLGSSGAGDPVGDPDELSAGEEKSGAETAGEKGDLLGAVGKLANVFAFGKLSDASAAASTADGTLPTDPDDDGTGGTGGARRAP